MKHTLIKVHTTRLQKLRMCFLIFTGNDVAKRAWAMAKVQHVNADSQSLALKIMHALSRVFAGNDVAKLAWAMAKVQHVNTPLLDAMADRVATVCSELLPFDEQGVCVCFVRSVLSVISLCSTLIPAFR